MNNTTLNYLLTSTPDNIHSVGFAYKLKNNQPTGVMSVQFFVKRKLPVTELNQDELLPSTVTVDNQTYETDVVEAKEFKALQCIGSRNGSPIFLGDYNWPSGEHRAMQRPIRGGIELIGKNITTPPQYASGFGTLGGIVTDTTDSTTVGITNAHVVGLALTNFDVRPVAERPGLVLEDSAKMKLYSGSLPQQTPSISGNQIWYSSVPGFLPGTQICENINFLGQTYYGIYPDAAFATTSPIVSTGVYGPLSAYCVNSDVGYIKRYSPITIKPDSFNILDVALITINTEANASLLNSSTPMLSAGYSHQQANFYHKNVCSFASTAEIDSLVTSNIPLFKSGRTTAATGWPNPIGAEVRFPLTTCNLSLSSSQNLTYYFLSGCDMRATSVDSSGGIGYDFGVANFQNMISFTATAGIPPVRGGDSGSLLYGLFNSSSPSTSAWKIVGLVFAGNSVDRALAVRIDNIVNTFGVSAYNSGQPVYTNLNNVKKQYLLGKSSIQALTGSDNKKYWQSGVVVKINGRVIESPGWVGPYRF